MRLAVISDTHMPRGGRALPVRCLEELRAADAILHGGDWTGPEAIDEIAALGPPVHGIHGNMDAAAVRARMPGVREVDLGGVRVGMVHDPGPALRRFERLRGAFPDADAVIFGHTHMPQHEGRDGFQIFNPGSPTERRRAPAWTMGIAKIESGRIEFELLALG